MNAKQIVKNSQEQAVASWINYLNQVRLDELMAALNQEKENLSGALSAISETLTKISRDIINNNRGGDKGIHGFIAEAAECGVENAKRLIEGDEAVCEWINDNGPVDLRRGIALIQQKFVNNGGHLSLHAIQEHLKKYPDFLDNGGIYQIPKDHYAKIKWLLSIPEDQANKMPKSEKFSLRQWREVHEFFDHEAVPLDKIEPSELEYRQVQRETYKTTLENEKKDLRERNRERKEQAYQKSKPTLSEGLKATAVSAVIEGGMEFLLAVSEKRKSGTKIKGFSVDDWSEIANKAGIGTIKGGVRGASIYTLTNFTATPAAVASAVVTASFGIAEQAHRLRNGELNETEFIENSEMVCLDAAVSALSSLAGQVLIPLPVLGAVIGNTIGSMMYQCAKKHLSQREQKLVEQYLSDISALKASLQDEYKAFVDELGKDVQTFMDLLDRAFVPDVRIAFEGSIELARVCGVEGDKILDSHEKIASYFMD